MQSIFNRALYRKRLARASEDFLLREMCLRLAERLNDINRTFPLALDIGSFGRVRNYVPESTGVRQWVELMPFVYSHGNIVVGDEEFLPFAPNRFDLIMACGSMHVVNDLPGMLLQIQRCLKPDGLFLAMMPGGQTLHELRTAFEAAEMKLRGGISPRVSPFIDIRDAGSLLQRAGFALPVVDSDLLEVRYTHPLKLLEDLRRMGQANALHISSKQGVSRGLMQRMAEEYISRFCGADGRVAATFELVTMTAWKPHASQQQPAKRGSGKVSMSFLEE